MSKPFSRVLCLSIAFCCASASAYADPTDGSASGPAPYLFGDWNGERTHLEDEGVSFSFGYHSEIAHNFTGGDKSLTRNAGQLSLGMDLDLQKLWGWQGAAFHFLVSERDGNNLSDDANLNELMQTQQIYGRGQTWHIPHLYLTQTLLDGHLDLSLGRMSVGDEFGNNECDFMGLALCGSQPGNLAGDYIYNQPLGQWGAVAKWNFSKNYYYKLGVYQVNPAYMETRHSLSLDPSGTTGMMIPTEFGWTPTFGSLAGTYVIGGWYSTADKKDVYTDVNGDAAGITGLDFDERTGAYGGYFTMQQQLTNGDGATPESGLRVFFTATQADRSTTKTDHEVTAGLVERGLVPNRPLDEFGFGVADIHVNTRYAEYEAEVEQRTGTFIPRQGNEYFAELFYSWQATSWLKVHPDIQWVQHPGGISTATPVRIVGLQTDIAF